MLPKRFTAGISRTDVCRPVSKEDFVVARIIADRRTNSSYMNLHVASLLGALFPNQFRLLGALVQSITHVAAVRARIEL